MPLHYCALSLSCFRRLLDAGADPNAIIRGNDRTAIHCVTYESDNLAAVQLLFQYGADIKSQNKNGNSLLHTAIGRKRFKITRWLIEQISDIEVRGSWGMSPWLSSLWSASQEISQMLLDRGADYTATDIYQEGTLHYAARYGDLHMIATLKAANLQLLDTHARSISGYNRYIRGDSGVTAKELAEWRRDKNEDWAMYCIQSRDEDSQNWFTAFKDLVDYIRASQIANNFGEFWASVDTEDIDAHLQSHDEGHNNQRANIRSKRSKSTLRDESPRPIPGSYPEETLNERTYTSTEAHKVRFMKVLVRTEYSRCCLHRSCDTP